MGVVVIRCVAAEDLQPSVTSWRRWEIHKYKINASGKKSLCVNMTGRSTHTLPGLGPDTVCIDGQESEIAEGVHVAARVVICWPEVVFEELIYLLHGAVEKWRRYIIFSGYIGFYVLNNIRWRVGRYSDP